MDTQKVGSPRSTDSPRRLPDHGATPLSPRTGMPRVLEREYQALLSSVGANDSLCQPVFDICSFITKLYSPIATECAKAGMPAKAEAMQAITAQISNALCQVETYYDRADFGNCHIYVTAAKGNQVLLLASIDALKQDPDGDQGFSDAHDQCAQLGQKIAALSQLINDRLRQQPPQQQQQQQQQQPTSPRPSSPRFVSSPEKHQKHNAIKPNAGSTHAGRPATFSPDRTTEGGRLEKLPSPTAGKRAQGDEDSPQMKNSPSKRPRKQAVEQTDTTLSQLANDAAMKSSGQTDTLSGMKPGSPTKLPKLDWSSAKPISSGPHLPISTTPRSPKQARTESKGNGKQGADNGLSASPAPGYDARIDTDSSNQRSAVPTSPPSVQSQANPDSPRKAFMSPSKPLKAQPRPRPPSMLFSSPPLPSATADLKERAVERGGATNGDLTGLQMPLLTLTSTSTVTTTVTTDGTRLAPNESDV
jgi:hypothetical protein